MTRPAANELDEFCRKVCAVECRRGVLSIKAIKAYNLYRTGQTQGKLMVKDSSNIPVALP